MARLTNYDRTRILKGLKPSFQKEVEVVKQTMSRLLNTFISKEIPTEIFVFMKKYPSLVLSSKNVYISLKNGSIYIKVNEHPSNYVSNLLSFALNNDKSGEISRTLDLLKLKAEEARILEKKISCILDNISTEKKLKDEFPEAYKVYMETSSDEEDSQNMCDSVENVRAELSKLNK